MPKRTICIQNPARLSSKSRGLIIEADGQKASIPFEDVWVVILETHSAQITTAALSDLCDAGIGVMLCNRSHLPNGLLLPIGAHSRHSAIVENQLAISKPLKKRLWQRIVISKIENQRRVLELLGLDDTPLGTMLASVRSGDTSNRESVAASMYFKQAMPLGGRHGSYYCSALDYGYTVLRAGVARSAVSGGWLVSRGLHHSSTLNAFNLVDDLIEPFRPVVDLLAFTFDLFGELTPAKKQMLARVFECTVLIEGKKYSVQTAIDKEMVSLRDAILGADAGLLRLPELLPIEFMQGE